MKGLGGCKGSEESKAVERGKRKKMRIKRQGRREVLLRKIHYNA